LASAEAQVGGLRAALGDPEATEKPCTVNPFAK